MKQHKVEVCGTKSNYIVDMLIDEQSNLHIVCNCSAGKYGKICKHVIDIMTFDCVTLVKQDVYTRNDIEAFLKDVSNINNITFMSEELRKVRKDLEEITTNKNKLERKLKDLFGM